MAKRPKQTMQKREKEKARAMKKQEKESRRIESKKFKENLPATIGGEDPDIAGIRPGPQPLPEQWSHGDNVDAAPEP
ncbi:MAG: hypothetical protein ACKVX9_13600 [Blastocatellia bacterium]